LQQLVFQGGADNVPALVRGWDVAAQRPGSVIVWIHAPQPVLLSHPLPLRQRWERRPQHPQLYELQTHNGPNLLTEQLDGLSAAGRANG
jgi:hypothetical protein